MILRGLFHAYWDSGMEEVACCLQEEAAIDPSGQWRPEGNHRIREGDDLVVLGEGDAVVWKGRVRFGWWSRRPELPDGWEDWFRKNHRGALEPRDAGTRFLALPRVERSAGEKDPSR